ncbi:MAG: threonine/serine dehydratase [Hyphomicrobiales bacterium]|nr:threonine/serine dehydratase [Hyphomicrobiales bacterium]
MTAHAHTALAAMPTMDDIRAAARRIEGLARRTPLLESPALNEKFGGRLLFKPEVLQRTGSFKFRGAYNKIASLTQEERARGVVAFSSGNHAQGVAAAAGLFGIRAVIVMPADAPAIKADNVRAMGAEIVPYDRYGQDREIVARPYVEQGMALVKPFDDPLIVAGQGTVGLEIAEDAAAMGARLDAVVTPCGGGGLMAGIATAIKALSPETQIWGAEPENFDDTRRSLAAGSRVGADPAGTSICDALMSPMPGELTFAINRKLVAGVVGVTETSVAAAMRDAAAHLKLVVEPGGAAAFAAFPSGEIALAGRTIAVVLSGGNVDLDLFARLTAAA